MKKKNFLQKTCMSDPMSRKKGTLRERYSKKICTGTGSLFAGCSLLLNSLFFWNILCLACTRHLTSSVIRCLFLPFAFSIFTFTFGFRPTALLVWNLGFFFVKEFPISLTKIRRKNPFPQGFQKIVVFAKRKYYIRSFLWSKNQLSYSFSKVFWTKKYTFENQKRSVLLIMCQEISEFPD